MISGASNGAPPSLSGTSNAAVLARFAAEVAEDLRRLAFLHDHEPDRDALASLRQHHFQEFLGLKLRSATSLRSLEILDQALAELPEAPDAKFLDFLAADFAAIYLNYTYRASPLESVWLDDDHLISQEPMFQVRSWFRRYGLSLPEGEKRSEDHLVYELHFVAHVLSLIGADGTGARDRLADAARFLDEHLLRWAGDFASRVAKRCTSQYFAGLSIVTVSYLEELRDLLAEYLGETRPTREEVEERLRAASPPPPKDEAAAAAAGC